MALSVEDRLALAEYKILALSLHVQRIESMLASIIFPSNPPTLAQMQSRLSEIDGIGGALPIETMTVAKAKEMLGNGSSPRVHSTIADLLDLKLSD